MPLDDPPERRLRLAEVIFRSPDGFERRQGGPLRRRTNAEVNQRLNDAIGHRLGTKVGARLQRRPQQFGMSICHDETFNSRRFNERSVIVGVTADQNASPAYSKVPAKSRQSRSLAAARRDDIQIAGPGINEADAQAPAGQGYFQTAQIRARRRRPAPAQFECVRECGRIGFSALQCLHRLDQRRPIPPPRQMPCHLLAKKSGVAIVDFRTEAADDEIRRRHGQARKIGQGIGDGPAGVVTKFRPRPVGQGGPTSGEARNALGVPNERSIEIDAQKLDAMTPPEGRAPAERRCLRLSLQDGFVVAGSVTRIGSVTVNVVPWPVSLRTETSPPINRQKRLEITKPSPVPP